MTRNYNHMDIIEHALSQNVPFFLAAALLAEADGDHAAAAEYLERAVRVETWPAIPTGNGGQNWRREFWQGQNGGTLAMGVSRV